VAGRIDFYIASKRWGIEITRDGKKLQEHSDCFGASGACGRWLASGKMSDYMDPPGLQKRPANQTPFRSVVSFLLFFTKKISKDLCATSKLSAKTRGWHKATVIRGYAAWSVGQGNDV
jgi:hypothetical protein